MSPRAKERGVGSLLTLRFVSVIMRDMQSCVTSSSPRWVFACLSDREQQEGKSRTADNCTVTVKTALRQLRAATAESGHLPTKDKASTVEPACYVLNTLVAQVGAPPACSHVPQTNL